MKMAGTGDKGSFMIGIQNTTGKRDLKEEPAGLFPGSHHHWFVVQATGGDGIIVLLSLPQEGQPCRKVERHSGGPGYCLVNKSPPSCAACGDCRYS